MDGIRSNTVSSSKPILSLTKTNFGGDSLSAAVCVTPSSLRVSEALAQSVLTLRPTLAQHTCKQQGFGHFGDKLVGTTLPHLIEHLTIDFLVEENAVPLPVAGTTKWLDHESGSMQVRISCAPEDADVTLAALTRAVTLVNSLLDQ
jgi:hypothetical protein